MNNIQQNKDGLNFDPIQFFLDEISDPRAHVRVSAMQNVCVLACAIGSEQTRTILLPYLCTSFLDSNEEVTTSLVCRLGELFRLSIDEFNHINENGDLKNDENGGNFISDKCARDIRQLLNLILQYLYSVADLSSIAIRSALVTVFRQLLGLCFEEKMYFHSTMLPEPTTQNKSVNVMMLSQLSAFVISLLCSLDCSLMNSVNTPQPNGIQTQNLITGQQSVMLFTFPQDDNDVLHKTFSFPLPSPPVNPFEKYVDKPCPTTADYTKTANTYAVASMSGSSNSSQSNTAQNQNNQPLALLHVRGVPILDGPFRKITSCYLLPFIYDAVIEAIRCGVDSKFLTECTMGIIGYNILNCAELNTKNCSIQAIPFVQFWEDFMNCFICLEGSSSYNYNTLPSTLQMQIQEYQKNQAILQNAITSIVSGATLEQITEIEYIQNILQKDGMTAEQIKTITAMQLQNKLQFWMQKLQQQQSSASIRLKALQNYETNLLAQTQQKIGGIKCSWRQPHLLAIFAALFKRLSEENDSSVRAGAATSLIMFINRTLLIDNLLDGVAFSGDITGTFNVNLLLGSPLISGEGNIHNNTNSDTFLINSNIPQSYGSSNDKKKAIDEDKYCSPIHIAGSSQPMTQSDIEERCASVGIYIDGFILSISYLYSRYDAFACDCCDIVRGINTGSSLGLLRIILSVKYAGSTQCPESVIAFLKSECGCIINRENVRDTRETLPQLIKSISRNTTDRFWLVRRSTAVIMSSFFQLIHRKLDTGDCATMFKLLSDDPEPDVRIVTLCSCEHVVKFLDIASLEKIFLPAIIKRLHDVSIDIRCALADHAVFPMGKAIIRSVLTNEDTSKKHRICNAILHIADTLLTSDRSKVRAKVLYPITLCSVDAAFKDTVLQQHALEMVIGRFDRRTMITPKQSCSSLVTLGDTVGDVQKEMFGGPDVEGLSYLTGNTTISKNIANSDNYMENMIDNFNTGSNGNNSSPSQSSNKLDQNGEKQNESSTTTSFLLKCRSGAIIESSSSSDPSWRVKEVLIQSVTKVVSELSKMPMPASQSFRDCVRDKLINPITTDLVSWILDPIYNVRVATCELIASCGIACGPLWFSQKIIPQIKDVASSTRLGYANRVSIASLCGVCIQVYTLASPDFMELFGASLFTPYKKAEQTSTNDYCSGSQSSMKNVMLTSMGASTSTLSSNVSNNNPQNSLFSGPSDVTSQPVDKNKLKSVRHNSLYQLSLKFTTESSASDSEPEKGIVVDLNAQNLQTLNEGVQPKVESYAVKMAREFSENSEVKNGLLTLFTILTEYAQDSIPNVRLAIAKMLDLATISGIIVSDYAIKNDNILAIIKTKTAGILEQLAKDHDPDVRMYTQNAIEQLDIE